ncbi:hypothetical protein QQ045_020328 [Rhodiola kirilowii]
MRDRRMKSLMGLNEVYVTSWSNILQMMPSPTLKECYKQLIQDENQRHSKKGSLTEMSALYVSQSSTFPTRGSQSSMQQQSGSQYSVGGSNNSCQSAARSSQGDLL